MGLTSVEVNYLRLNQSNSTGFSTNRTEPNWTEPNRTTKEKKSRKLKTKKGRASPQRRVTLTRMSTHRNESGDLSLIIDRRQRDVGILLDLVASNPRISCIHATLLRRTRDSSVRSNHRRIHLVLLRLRHHPRSGRYLDGNHLLSSCLSPFHSDYDRLVWFGI